MHLIGHNCTIHRKITYSPRHAQFRFFGFKKVSKQNESCLTVLRLQATAEIRKLLSKMVRPPWVHGSGLDTFYQEKLATAAKDFECTTLKAPEHL